MTKTRGINIAGSPFESEIAEINYRIVIDKIYFQKTYHKEIQIRELGELVKQILRKKGEYVIFGCAYFVI